MCINENLFLLLVLKQYNAINQNENFSDKGLYLNNVYTEGGGGLTKCRRSKGGCVDLHLKMLPKCK